MRGFAVNKNIADNYYVRILSSFTGTEGSVTNVYDRTQRLLHPRRMIIPTLR